MRESYSGRITYAANWDGLDRVPFWDALENISIEFGEDEAAWRRFFASYRDFIVDQAKFAERHEIEMFSIGIEYERTRTGRNKPDCFFLRPPCDNAFSRTDSGDPHV